MKSFLKNLIPAKLQFRMVSLKHTLTRFRQTYYSQNCEDVIVRSMFPKNHKGFYVDIGAHHPYRISNTYLLFKKGWRGINVDPNPVTISLFNTARPNDINLQVGVAGQVGELEYHQFSDPAVNTFSASEAERWKNKSWLTFLGVVKVKVTTLKALLQENLPEGIPCIDLLTVDVEGLDFEVLKSNDWAKFTPKVVVVEAHDFSLETMTEHPIYRFLHEKGYTIEHKMKFSLVFKHQSHLL